MDKNPRTAAVKRFLWFFIWGSLVPIIFISTIGYFSMRSILETNAIERLLVINETKAGEFSLFLERLKIRIADWSSDGKIRKLAEDIDSGKCSNISVFKECFIVSDLSSHIKDKKMPLDSSIAITDVLDINGNVVASSDKERIGKNEKDEHFNSIEEIKKASFGQTLLEKEIFIDEEEYNKPMFHLFSPLIGLDSEKVVGILLIHIVSDEMKDILKISRGETLESYLVNKGKLMITSSKFVADAALKQRVDTEPVKACWEEGKNFQGTYKNYLGQQVLGVSQCIPYSFGALITEVSVSEAFESIIVFRNITLLVSIFFLFFVVIFGFFTGKKINIIDLQARVEELSSIISSIKDGLFVIGADSKIILMNSVAEDILEIKSSEAVGKIAGEIFKIYKNDKEVDWAESPIVLSLKNKKPVSITMEEDFYFMVGSGKKMPITLVSAPFERGFETGAAVVFHNISREKAIDKAKSEFVSLASHQLRTPPTIINWHIEELLSGDFGKLNDQQKEYLEEIYNANKRMIDLINSILNVSKIELGTFTIEKNSVDIMEISKSTLNNFNIKRQIAQKGIKIKEIYGKAPIIQGDQKIIEIVFQNLISNAVKYTPNNGLIEIEIIARANDVLVKVSDSGCGIPKADQQKIFTKFFRSDNAKGLDPEGNGLGLYIVKAMIKQIGGKIWFESEENKGTTFYFTIPLN